MSGMMPATPDDPLRLGRLLTIAALLAIGLLAAQGVVADLERPLRLPEPGMAIPATAADIADAEATARGVLIAIRLGLTLLLVLLMLRGHDLARWLLALLHLGAASYAGAVLWRAEALDASAIAVALLLLALRLAVGVVLLSPALRRYVRRHKDSSAAAPWR